MTPEEIQSELASLRREISNLYRILREKEDDPKTIRDIDKKANRIHDLTEKELEKE